MKPWKHQVDIAKQAANKLSEYLIVYLAMEERTGKSLTALLTTEQVNVQSVLILTKKKALTDWDDLIVNQEDLTKDYFVTNYHSAWRLPANYDLVILDEAHNYISAYPKIGTTETDRRLLRKKGKDNRNIYDACERLCAGKPIIYLSATPYAQGPQLLYHQLSLSKWSPWRQWRTFYSWFKEFGIPYTIELRGRSVNQYDKAQKSKVVQSCEHLFITKTRKELGFEKEPEDVLHFVELDSSTKEIYNELNKDDMAFLAEWHEPLVCDTVMKLRTSLHMLEGGGAKIDHFEKGKKKANYIVLSNTEKVDYIKAKWGDTEGLVIMYNYKVELIKLQDHFKHAVILQATSFSEGIDLSGFSTLVVYSQDYSTARHTQRRARQCNMYRDTDIDINYILVKKAVSHQAYNTVSVNKKNYVDSTFERTKL